jgi:hypothetical protein
MLLSTSERQQTRLTLAFQSLRDTKLPEAGHVSVRPLNHEIADWEMQSLKCRKGWHALREVDSAGCPGSRRFTGRLPLQPHCCAGRTSLSSIHDVHRGKYECKKATKGELCAVESRLLERGWGSR